MSTDRPRLRAASTVVLVTLCVLTTLLALVLAADAAVSPEWSYWTGAVLSVFLAVGVVWRHRYPWPLFVAAVAVPLVVDTDATASLVALTAVLLAGSPRPVLGDVGAVLAAYAASVVALIRDAHRPAHLSVLSMAPAPEPGEPWVYGAAPDWAPFLAATALVGAVAGIALLRRAGRRVSVAEEVRDRAAEQEHRLRDEVVRTEERTRIARDMHDTLAAALSRISLFAGGLQVSGNDDPEKVAGTAALIRETAHGAMADLRDIVGVLRGGGDGGYGPRHQGVEGIAGIVAGARAAGIRVRLVEEQAPGTVGVVAGQTAYRVVQEAMTNVQKHAPRQAAEVTVSGDEAAGLRIRVANDLPPAPGTAIGSRAGLTGLSELAAQIGGHVEAGPTGGRWVVDCWLPWHG